MDLHMIRQELKRRSIYDLPLRVTFYARVSSESDEQLNSLGNQISYYENLIRKNVAWTWRHLHTFLGPGALHLVAVVLEPDLHLRGRQADKAGQVLALGRRQVPLLPEAPLQLVGLRFGEEHPPLPLLAGVPPAAGGLLVIVR